LRDSSLRYAALAFQTVAPAKACENVAHDCSPKGIWDSRAHPRVCDLRGWIRELIKSLGFDINAHGTSA